MKKLILFTILIAFMINADSQTRVYDLNGGKRDFISEELDITFSESAFKFPLKVGKELVPALIPFSNHTQCWIQTNTASFRKICKDFSAAYTKHKSNLSAVSGTVPEFTFNRYVVLNSGLENALSISFKAKQIGKLSTFIYYIDSLNLQFSAAKSKKRGVNTFDYSIEIKPTYLIKGEKKLQEEAPIVISSVKYGSNKFSQFQHRSDIIPKPQRATMTEISLKIIETNPKKVRAEKILSLWNDNKEDVKTITNNFLPKG